MRKLDNEKESRKRWRNRRTLIEWGWWHLIVSVSKSQRMNCVRNIEVAGVEWIELVDVTTIFDNTFAVRDVKVTIDLVEFEGTSEIASFMVVI